MYTLEMGAQICLSTFQEGRSEFRVWNSENLRTTKVISIRIVTLGGLNIALHSGTCARGFIDVIGSNDKISFGE